jgi:TRAP-type C4-dicarboxylate transport system substrate-binding protein
MRRIQIRTALVLALLAVATLPSMAEGRQEEVVLRVASPFKTGHILVDAAEKFKATIEAETGGRITALVIAGAATEEDVNIQCSRGVVDIQLTGGRPLEVFSPQYFFFNAPYVIKDYEHFVRVWNGPLGKKAKDLVLANGNLIDMGTVYRGLRQTTSNKPLTGPADLVGLKLRLPVVQTWIDVWQSLATVPVPVPLTELYQALKDGRAEASEGDLPQVVSFKLAEVQSQLSITNHLVAIGWVMINKGSHDRLSSADRKRVMDVMSRTCAWATEKTKANEGELLAQLKKAGMTVTQPDAAAIREKAKPAVEKLFKTAFPVTTWAEVLAQ